MFAQARPAMLAGLKEAYPRVVWNGAYIEWETGKVVCVWDAPDAESIKALLHQVQFPYEDMYPVEWMTPHDVSSGA